MQSDVKIVPRLNSVTMSGIPVWYYFLRIYVCVCVNLIKYLFCKHIRIILDHIFNIEALSFLSLYSAVYLTFICSIRLLCWFSLASLSLCISWFLKATNTFPHLFLLLSRSISLKPHTIRIWCFHQGFSISLCLMLTLLFCCGSDHDGTKDPIVRWLYTAQLLTLCMNEAFHVLCFFWYLVLSHTQTNPLWNKSAHGRTPPLTLCLLPPARASPRVSMMDDLDSCAHLNQCRWRVKTSQRALKETR